MAGLLSAAATAAAPASAAAPVRVVLGTMTFAGQTDKESALRMVRKFAASPLSLTTPELDSARMYCGGQTEELLGEVLAELGTEKDSEDGEPPCAVATKANPFMDNTLTAEGVTAQLDATLRALQPAGSVDVFYLHAPDAAVAIEETLEAVQAAFERHHAARGGRAVPSAAPPRHVLLCLQPAGGGHADGKAQSRLGERVGPLQRRDYLGQDLPAAVHARETVRRS
jgi:aryl-alcohol dehydrogenase-like predicted oxidoreductase